MNAATANVVFAPYSYVLDPRIRATQRLDVRGSILIIDEAHNVDYCAIPAAPHSPEPTPLTSSTYFPFFEAPLPPTIQTQPPNPNQLPTLLSPHSRDQ